MDGAAARFPDMAFGIFHVGRSSTRRVGSSRATPALYASIAATTDFVARSARRSAEWIGRLGFWCGEDGIICGSETPIWHPKWALDAFWDFEIPQDPVEGYG